MSWFYNWQMLLDAKAKASGDGSADLPKAPGEGSLNFAANNWTGYVTAEDFERENKLVVYGPAPPGMFGYIEGALMVLLCMKLVKTDAGQEKLKQIINKYLDTTSDVLGNLYRSSAAHPLTAIMNNHTAVSIYERLGLMSSEKALHERAWIDHVLGEMLKLSYVGDMLHGVETLVQSSTRGGPGVATRGMPALLGMLGKP